MLSKLVYLVIPILLQLWQTMLFELYFFYNNLQKVHFMKNDDIPLKLY